ncbi:MAG: hypothetical protein ABSE91_01965 [Patescibacteria group bacterium]
MKKVAAERPPVVAIPDVVGVTIVAVEPTSVLVAFDVEHLEVAVGVRQVQNALRSHCSSITLRAVFYFGPFNPLAFCTKYLHFLSIAESLYAKKLCL